MLSCTMYFPSAVGYELHVGMHMLTYCRSFSEAHLLGMAAVLACAMGWSSAHGLAELCSTVCFSSLQGFLMQPANPAVVQTALSRGT